MTWKRGFREPAYFPTYQASLDAAANLWATSYVRFPDVGLATKWTGNDHPTDWLKTVQTVYASL